MQQETNRDRAIDSLLRETLRARPGSETNSDSHIDAQTIAAWAEGTLGTTDAAAVDTHVSACAACQEVLAVFARTEPVLPAESLWQRWRLQWVVPIAAAATAVAIWVAVPGNDPVTITQDRDVAREIDSFGPAQEKSANAARQATSIPPSPPELESTRKRDAGDDHRIDGNGIDSRGRPFASAEDGRGRPLGRPSGRPSVSAEDGRGRPSGRPSADLSKTAPAAEARSVDAVAPREETVDRLAAAAPPTAAASPAAVAQRREAALLRDAVAPVEIVSPTGLNRWRIVGTRVERSTTGGKTWEAASIDAPGELTAGSSPALLVCWVVGRGGVIRVTEDGARFGAVPFVEIVDLVGVTAVSATSAVVTTADGRRFRTTDRGINWVQEVQR